MRICFIGAYDRQYPRNVVIRKALKGQGISVYECWLPPGQKFWMRYPLLLLRSIPCLFHNDVFFVPEFCQKDVPLARFLSLLACKKVVFDPLASRFETKIMDWKRKPVGSWQAWWNFRIDRWAFRLCDLVLADTQVHKDYYCQQYRVPHDKVAVLRLGFDSGLFRRMPPAEKPQDGSLTVLFFGSFLPLHGVKTIIHAAKILSEKDPSVHFRLVGSGQTWPEARNLASQLRLGNVRFENWLPQRLLPQKIVDADVCLGVFGEGEKTRRVIPHKILQAMGMGKPVITLCTPAAEEVFTHKENIFFCFSPHPSELALAILKLKEDSGMRARIAEGGYQLVSEKFTPEATGNLLVDILEKHFHLSSKGSFR
ncbi:MAG: glycosyltransferase [Candidatus Aminicenantales bacterium]